MKVITLLLLVIYFVENSKNQETANDQRCPKKYEAYVECAGCGKVCSGGKLLHIYCYVCHPGCDCKPGYIRNEDTNTCIPEEDCQKCGLNEEYNSCLPNCYTRCINGNLLLPKCLPPDSCKGGCVCKDGYVLNENNVCIPLKDCHPKCPCKNEEYRTCLSSSCDIPTCSNPNIIYERPDICTADCRSTCVCINKTVRHPNGTCVPPSECPTS